LISGAIAGARNLWDRFSAADADWELAHLRRNKFGGGQDPVFSEVPQTSSLIFGRRALPLKSLMMSLAVLAVAGSARTTLAQNSWVFTNEIPCATAPVYGVQLNRCWTSNIRAFRIGTVQSWRLTYTDSKSEFAIGLYRLVAAHGVGGLNPVASAGAADWLRTADALKNVTTGGSGWTLTGSAAGDHYVTFQKAQHQCIGFVRNGPGAGQLNWIMGAAFCRESATPIPTSEAQFVADAVKVRD
jgi:hypothetical protein